MIESHTENNIFQKNEKPAEMLVSIVVVTYNSAKYVLETLQSAKAQTHQRIELIITDDCSTDNTVETCRKWIEENRVRFIRAELITAEKNTGIPANCNRGVKAANSEWIKLVAGDDILDKNCIKEFIDYSVNNPEASVISSSIQFFAFTFRKENFGKIIVPERDRFFDIDNSSYQQYKMLLRINYVPGPSTIFKRKAILDVGGFDEKYRMMEDHPIHLKLTKAGYRIYALKIVTIFYRQHDSSVMDHYSSTSHHVDRIFSDFYLIKRPFNLDYIYPNITMIERIADNIEFIRLCLFDWLGLNKETSSFYKLLFSFTDMSKPIRIIRYHELKKIIKL